MANSNISFTNPHDSLCNVENSIDPEPKKLISELPNSNFITINYSPTFI